MNILQATNIVKFYGQLKVLREVSLSIEQGSFVSIMGASGAGKSTLMHILGSLDTPHSGDVTINGQSLFRLNSKQQSTFRNGHLGFVFQFHHLLPEFTATENVAMPLWISGMNKLESLKAARAILERVGLKHRLEHKPQEMSGGEQQRVAIARAVVHNPSILLADEPTGNLDTENAEAVHELFLDLQKEKGLTLIVVTHNEDLSKISDRVLYMKDGIIDRDSDLRS